MLMSAFLLRFKAKLSRKNAWLPQFFMGDSSSPCKDLLFPRGPNLAQTPLYLVGTVFNSGAPAARGAPSVAPYSSRKEKISREFYS